MIECGQDFSELSGAESQLTANAAVAISRSATAVGAVAIEMFAFERSELLVAVANEPGDTRERFGDLTPLQRERTITLRCSRCIGVSSALCSRTVPLRRSRWSGVSSAKWRLLD
jgi:hypothetical protein